VPRELARAQVAEVWAWAIQNWDGARLQGLQSVAAPV
jgi:hypothetical protein